MDLLQRHLNSLRVDEPMPDDILIDAPLREQAAFPGET